jgi:hypothetical protein
VQEWDINAEWSETCDAAALTCRLIVTNQDPITGHESME